MDHRQGTVGPVVRFPRIRRRRRPLRLDAVIMDDDEVLRPGDPKFEIYRLAMETGQAVLAEQAEDGTWTIQTFGPEHD